MSISDPRYVRVSMGHSNPTTQSAQVSHCEWWEGERRGVPIDTFLTLGEAPLSSVTCHYSSIGGAFRACLRSDTRRFESSRRRTAEPVGRVARRAGGGGLAASSSRSIAAAQAEARLRNCDREPDDEAVIVGPATPSTLAQTAGDKPARSISMDTVTAVSEVLACWPPGPPERVAIHATASAAIANPRGVRYRPSTGSTTPLWRTED